MKLIIRYGIVALFIFGLSTPGRVNAQEGMLITPSQVTIAGVKGAIEKRVLLLRAKIPISELKIFPLDLNRDDGNTVLPSDAISAKLPAISIKTNGLLAIPLKVNLTASSSGEFKGQLMFKYKGGVQSVPLTVKVKDPFKWPLILLLLGVTLGIGVSAYRSKGKPRDEIIVRINNIRDQISKETNPIRKTTFPDRIDAYLLDAEADLQSNKWNDAREVLKLAEEMLLRWRKGKTDWLKQFGYYTELEKRLKSDNLSGNSFVQALQWRLDDAKRNAPELEGPDKFRKQLEPITIKINQYLQLEADFDTLNKLRLNLEENICQEWEPKVLAFRQRMQALTPDAEDESDYETLAKEMKRAIDEMRNLPLKSKDRSLSGVRDGGGATETGVSGVEVAPPAPAAHAIPTLTWWSDARIRLTAFTWASYIIAVLLLAGTGFGELYIANSTFGANTWSDYFALMAWGFGSEASRASITDMVRGWGVGVN